MAKPLGATNCTSLRTSTAAASRCCGTEPNQLMNRQVTAFIDQDKASFRAFSMSSILGCVLRNVTEVATWLFLKLLCVIVIGLRRGRGTELDSSRPVIHSACDPARTARRPSMRQIHNGPVESVLVEADRGSAELVSFFRLSQSP